MDTARHAIHKEYPSPKLKQEIPKHQSTPKTQGTLIAWNARAKAPNRKIIKIANLHCNFFKNFLSQAQKRHQKHPINKPKSKIPKSPFVSLVCVGSGRVRSLVGGFENVWGLCVVWGKLLIWVRKLIGVRQTARECGGLWSFGTLRVGGGGAI